MLFRRFLLACALAGVLAGAWATARRPLPGPALELALSQTAARRFATAQGYDLQRLLADYRQAGVTSLLVGETTLFDLTNQQQMGYPDYPVRVSVRTGGEVLARQAVAAATPATAFDPDRVYVFVRDNPALAAWLEGALAARLGAGRVRGLPGQGPGQAVLELQAFTGPGADAGLMLLPLGIFPPDVALARAAGLRVVYAVSQRPAGKTGPVYRLADVPAALELPGAPPGALVWLAGDEVPGYPGREPEAAAALARQGARVAVHRGGGEAGRPVALGAPELVAALAQGAVKALPVTYRETAAAALAAVQEAGVRLLIFVPAPLTADPGADVQRLTDKVRAVRAGAAAAGLVPGAPAGPAYQPPAWAVALAALGAAAALVELAFRYWAPAPGSGAAALVAGLAALALLAAAPALALAGPAGARPLLAALGGVALATLGVLSAASRALDEQVRTAVAAVEGRVDQRPLADWQAGARLALRMAAYAAAGGLLARGLLADDGFWLGLAAVPAPGAIWLGPGLLFAAYWVWQRRTVLLRRARPALGAAVGVGPLALLLAAAGALVLLLAPGADTPPALAPGALVAVPEEPGALAALARRALGVLPGGREVLVGYPAVFLAAFLLRHGRRTAGLAALTAGALAPAAVLAGLLAADRPLAVALWQTLHGFWLGLLVGGALLLALHAGRRPAT